MHQQKGFTLIEILIAITILSFLMMGVYTMVDNSASLQTKVKKEDQGLVDMETAMARIDQDFATFYTPLFWSVEYSKDEGQQTSTPSLAGRQEYLNQMMSTLKTFEPSDRFPGITKRGNPFPAVMNEEKGELSFLTTTNRRKHENSKQSSYAWVRYYTRTQEKREGDPDVPGMLELLRQYSPIDPYSDEFDWENIRSHVLLRNIKSFAFAYWDKNKERWVDAIKELEQGPGSLRLMRLQYTTYDPGGNELDFIRSFRVLWPWFDTVKDDAALQKAIEAQSAADKEAPPEGGE